MNDKNKSNKNMVECKACGKDIAKGVKKCPHCGKDQRNFFMRHKILTGTLVLIVIVFFAAMGGDSSDTAADEGSEVADTDETEYGLDEWWEVEDQWKLKIDSVRFTDERNQFSDKEPEAVVVIKYSYENLGYESDSQDLFMTPDNVIDAEGKVASTYPAGAEVSAKATPVGARTDGAEESYGLTSDEGEIDIHFKKYDDSSNQEKAVFTISLPND